MWVQKKINLQPMRRGFHLLTPDILKALPELRDYRMGLLHAFIQHTSASLTLNENADPDVRQDMEAFFSRLVPENEPYYRHTLEGADDMPAHIKASMLGPELAVPVTDGRLALGTWQGIYLCEHRNHASGRSVIITLHGEKTSTGRKV